MVEIVQGMPHQTIVMEEPADLGVVEQDCEDDSSVVSSPPAPQLAVARTVA